MARETLTATISVKWRVYPLLAVTGAVLVPISRVVDVTRFVDRFSRFVASHGMVYDVY